VGKVFADFRTHREKTGHTTSYLFGHSAGARYAHRMVEFVPEAKAKMVIAANSGWYTLPDLNLDCLTALRGPD
jgi:ribulose 1,5-bisphosphate carboxylase large subunit-like protein